MSVGAIVFDGARVLLVKRGHPPLKGEWSLPGGVVELGETLEQAVTREIFEETGLQVRVGPVVEVLDRIVHDTAGHVQYHYVLVDYLCWPDGGTLAAGSDVGEVALAHPRHLESYRLTDTARSVIDRAFELAGTVNP